VELSGWLITRRENSNMIVGSWEDFEKGVESGGYIFAHWCEDSDCEAKIKEKTKATTRYYIWLTLRIK